MNKIEIEDESGLDQGIDWWLIRGLITSRVAAGFGSTRTQTRPISIWGGFEPKYQTRGSRHAQTQTALPTGPTLPVSPSRDA
jgi:hypothetical protein